MQKTELSDGVQKTASSFSLVNPDVSSLEGELVNKKKEDKTRQSWGKARQGRDLQVNMCVVDFIPRNLVGIYRYWFSEEVQQRLSRLKITSELQFAVSDMYAYVASRLI